MERKINKFLAISGRIEYYYQLTVKEKMELYVLCDRLESLGSFSDFMNEKIRLNEMLTIITRGKSIPDIDYKLNTERFMFKDLSPKEYHEVKKKIYKKIDDMKYLTVYRKLLLNFMSDEPCINSYMRSEIFQEIRRIDNFINQNKNLDI